MVPGKLPVPGRLYYVDIVGAGPTVLADGAGGGCWTFFLSSFISPALWDTV